MWDHYKLSHTERRKIVRLVGAGKRQQKKGLDCSPEHERREVEEGGLVKAVEKPMRLSTKFFKFTERLISGDFFPSALRESISENESNAAGASAAVECATDDSLRIAMCGNGIFGKIGRCRAALFLENRTEV